jgi:hypothetical protein
MPQAHEVGPIHRARVLSKHVPVEIPTGRVTAIIDRMQRPEVQRPRIWSRVSQNMSCRWAVWHLDTPPWYR